MPHPYTPAGNSIIQVVEQLRRSFPATVDASTLKKLGIAPNNESYLINILRFLKIIGEDGAKLPPASKVFSLHDDAEFAKAFAELVKASYSELFNLHQDGAWVLSLDKLIGFFRHTDGSSAVVGERQAKTFKVLAGVSGHNAANDKPAASTNKPPRARPVAASSPKQAPRAASAPAPAPPVTPAPSTVGLTVRIEVNLPATGTQETYDYIFQSIRKNLIDGK